ncbi:hypothetical protein MTP99_008997 [Tenebrio molitor]|jgi:hypothetical protein|nr:hypothetical protein MTP99_008997 [Tenebrio molitor]
MIAATLKQFVRQIGERFWVFRRASTAVASQRVVPREKRDNRFDLNLQRSGYRASSESDREDVLGVSAKGKNPSTAGTRGLAAVGQRASRGTVKRKEIQVLYSLLVTRSV